MPARPLPARALLLIPAMTRASIALSTACLILASSACVTAPDERAAAPAPPFDVPPRAEPAPAASASAAPAAPAKAAPERSPVRLFIEESRGAESARLRAMFAPAETAVAECVPGSAGIVRLRITSGAAGARFTFEPNASLDPRRRRCVLEALSTIDPVGVSAGGSPSDRPSGFTALLRIEW